MWASSDFKCLLPLLVRWDDHLPYVGHSQLLFLVYNQHSSHMWAMLYFLFLVLPHHLHHPTTPPSMGRPLAICGTLSASTSGVQPTNPVPIYGAFLTFISGVVLSSVSLHHLHHHPTKPAMCGPSLDFYSGLTQSVVLYSLRVASWGSNHHHHHHHHHDNHHHGHM